MITGRQGGGGIYTHTHKHVHPHTHPLTPSAHPQVESRVARRENVTFSGVVTALERARDGLEVGWGMVGRLNGMIHAYMHPYAHTHTTHREAHTHSHSHSHRNTCTRAPAYPYTHKQVESRVARGEDVTFSGVVTALERARDGLEVGWGMVGHLNGVIHASTYTNTRRHTHICTNTHRDTHDHTHPYAHTHARRLNRGLREGRTLPFRVL